MKTFIKNLLLSLFFITMISIQIGCDTEKQQIIYLKNNKIKLGFSNKNGALVVFKDLVNSHEYLDKKHPLSSIWEIDLILSQGIFNTKDNREDDVQLDNSNSKKIDMTHASKFHFIKENDYSLTFIWEGFETIQNKDFKVTGVISVDENEPETSWKISVEGIKDNNIHRVAFPKISGIKDLGDEEYLALPIWMGTLYENPRKQLRNPAARTEWGYPGHPLSIQLLALYDPDEVGFYASSNDSLSHKKSFSLSLDTTNNNLTYQMNHYPPYTPELNSYTTPYEAIVRSFKGDWITAAEQYREWGTKQRWASESRFKNKLTPSWLEETAIWVWNRQKSDNVLVPAAELKKRLGLPVNVFWHWWHRTSYDDEFPEYFPPREGDKSFKKALSLAHDQEIRAIVYMNAWKWGPSAKSWKDENASYYAVKNINGGLNSHVYNKFTGKALAEMCMATDFWKNKYSTLADTAIDMYNIDGVYMDQACQSTMCYDINHGHVLAGGNYWVENFAKLTKNIRSNITENKNNPILAGEGCGESWLPQLDLMLTLDVSMERYKGGNRGKPIPMFQAVYHEYAITYGNYSSLLVPPYDELWPKEYAPKEPLKLLNNDYSKQFLMEQARSFAWGLQPTIANYQPFLHSERKVEAQFLMDLAKVRYNGLKYLLYGKFLRSPDFDPPEELLEMSRISIYAGKTGNAITRFKKKFPLIFSGTWQAPDNQVGIALANIGDESFPVNFNINAKQYELPSSGEVYIIDSNKKRKLTAYSNNRIKISFELPPKGLCIVEIAPNS